MYDHLLDSVIRLHYFPSPMKNRHTPTLKEYVIEGIQRRIAEKSEDRIFQTDGSLNTQRIHSLVPSEFTSAERISIVREVCRRQQHTAEAVSALGVLSDSTENPASSELAAAVHASHPEASERVDTLTVDHEAVFDQVRVVLEDVLIVDFDDITRESTLIEDLGAESIYFLSIIFALNRDFNCNFDLESIFPKFPQSEGAPKPVTVADIVQVVEKKIATVGVNDKNQKFFSQL